MKNITLAIDEGLLDEVRVYAAKRGTTVNALVREFLGQIAKSEDRKVRAVCRLQELSKASKAEIGDVTWKREDLYDR